MLMNRDQGVEPVTMCLVCLRPALQHGCWFNCYPVLADWMNTVYRGPARFHQSTPNKRFELMSSNVIMAVSSLFSRMLLSTYLIPVYLLHCGRNVMIGCNLTSLEWIGAVRHIYGIIRHMQGHYLYVFLNDLGLIQKSITGHGLVATFKGF